MENNNEYILSLLVSGLSVLPIAEGKKIPHSILGPSHNLLTERATTEEVQKWIDSGIKSWGLANGQVSGNLMTLDFDEKHYPGLYDLWYNRLSVDQKSIVDLCYKNSTRNHGTHLRYRTETPQPTTKLAQRWEFSQKTGQEEIVTTAETRGDGAYALIPPSDGYTTISGDLLKLPVVTDELHEELIDVLRSFNEIVDEPVPDYEWVETNINGTSDRPGDRLNYRASWNEILEPHGWVEEQKNRWRRPGKSDGEGISATTDYDGHPMFYVFSTSASPFEANKGYSKFHVFALLNHGGDFSLAAKAANELYQSETATNPAFTTSIKKNQAGILLDIVESKDNVTLFHDDKKESYISVKINDYQQIIAIKSRLIKKWLTREFWTIFKKAVNAEAIREAVSVLEGKACFDGPMYKLHNRLAWKDGDLWYDLIDDKWQAIKVNDSGWEIIKEPPILFHRYSHSQSQITPSPTGGDVNLIFKYINITNKDHQLLLLIFLISCFLPDFPHPFLVIFGPQGSCKTTLSKLLRRIVDPSLIEVASMPEKKDDLVQALAHHTFLFFDNVSYISESTSDTLCKAVTGSGFVKRELYSDDDDIIYRLKRCIGINGINLVSTRPDLLDRSLLLELERIEDDQRKSDKEIFDSFEKDLPLILGGIFDALSQVLKIKPTIKLTELPRMADFAEWGSAIAKTIGSTQEEFLRAYQDNIDKQIETILNENMVAMTIIGFMEGRYWARWEGTSTELLEKLTLHAEFDNKRITQDKYWPKAPQVLSRALNTLKITLRDAGLSVIISKGKKRKITLEKISAPEILSQETVQSIPNDVESEDGADDSDD
ncbi:MAG: bifunctional DNA primase/polymerase [Candidatus Paceibacterota bacterium]